MENKKYVIQRSFSGGWQDAYQGTMLLEYDNLDNAKMALNTIRNQIYDWRIVLRIEIEIVLY